MRKYSFTIHQIDTHNNIPKSQCLNRCLVFYFIRIVVNPSVFFRCCFRITRRFMLRRKTNSTPAQLKNGQIFQNCPWNGQSGNPVRFTQTCNIWNVCDVKKMYTFTTDETFFVPEPLWNSDKEKLIKFRIDFFCCSVISPFAINLFLLQIRSHCSMKNIGFRDSGYVIKPPQPSSAIYGAPPFTVFRS